MSKVSIIIPVYNVYNYLKDCVESILNQTFTDIEILLVDDGSTDGSCLLCDEYKIKDQRVKVFHTNNQGVSKARNFGIEKATGEYILFCDSDDIVDRTWCEKLYKLKCEDKNSYVGCGILYYNKRLNSKNTAKAFVSNDNILHTTKHKYFCEYKVELIESVCNKIYSKKIILENNIKFNENMAFGEDLIFNLKYIKCTNDNVTFINEPLYIYVKRFMAHENLTYSDIIKKILKKLIKGDKICKKNGQQK